MYGIRQEGSHKNGGHLEKMIKGISCLCLEVHAILNTTMCHDLRVVCMECVYVVVCVWSVCMECMYRVCVWSVCMMWCVYGRGVCMMWILFRVCIAECVCERCGVCM